MRPTRTSIGPLAAVLAAATLVTPATATPLLDSPAQRRHVESTIPTSQDLRSPDTRDAAEGRTTRDAAAPTTQNLSSPDARDAAEGRSTADVAAPVIHVSRATGFDWGDAAIGAGGATGLLAISLAAAMTLRRRQSDPHTSAAIG